MTRASMVTAVTIKLITPLWRVPSSVVAYTTTREGGVSTGPYFATNLGQHVGDDGRDVQRNRALLPYAENITWLEQTHSNRCVLLPTQQLRSADAAVSRAAGEFCAIMTADCIPILLTNIQGNEVAAIHAGWKGLLNGIIHNTLATMRSTPNTITAWIGPCIRRANYQVPIAFAAQFRAWPDAIHPINSTSAQLDLALIARQQMQAHGVATIIDSGLCTYMDEVRFFSHRRATQTGRQVTGRLATVIGFVDTGQ